MNLKLQLETQVQPEKRDAAHLLWSPWLPSPPDQPIPSTVAKSLVEPEQYTCF